jgi:uncharacterized Zn finger protein
MDTLEGALSRTCFAIECPECRNYTEKPLISLRAVSDVHCESCGNTIDIDNEKYRAEIDVLVNQLTRSGY